MNARTAGPHTKLEAFNAGLAAAHKVRDVEVSALTADNARLKEALAWMIDEVSVLGFDRMPGDTMADLVKASDNARDVLGEARAALAGKE